VGSLPVYRPQVAQAGRRPVYQDSPGSSGLEALGQGLEQAAATGSSIERHVREQDAALEATRLSNDLDATATPILAEYKNRPGSQALDGDLPTVVLQKIEEKRQQLIASASDAAKAVFASRSRGQIETYRSAVVDHAEQQRQVAQVDAAGAARKAAIDKIPLVYADPKALARVIAEPEGPMMALRKSDPGGAQDVADWRRTVHGAVVALMLDKDHDPDGAAAYLALHRKELGADLPQLEHDVRVAGRAKQADVLSTYYLDLSRTGDRDGWADPIVALERTNDIQDVQVKQEVQEALVAKIKLAEAVKHKQIGDTADGIFSTYLTGGYAKMAHDQAVKIDWLKRRAPDEWRKIQMAIRSDAEYYRRLENGEGGETDAQRQAFVEFQDDLVMRGSHYDASYTPSSLRSDWRHRLSPHDYERAGALLAGHHQQIEKGLGVSQLEFKTAIDAALAPYPEATKQQRAELVGSAKMWLDSQFRADVTPTRAEMDKAIGEEVKAWRYRTIFGNYVKPKFMVPPAEFEDDTTKPVDASASPAATSNDQAVDAAFDDAARAALVRMGVKNPTPQQLAAMRARAAGL
jgi:hypothetical protein